MMQTATRTRYRDASPWTRIQSDLDTIKAQMVTKGELGAMMATKADAAVAEDRWKNVWQDIAEMRSELRNRPVQQDVTRIENKIDKLQGAFEQRPLQLQQQNQANTQNLIQGLGCSINALYVLIAGVGLFFMLATLIVSILALIRA